MVEIIARRRMGPLERLLSEHFVKASLIFLILSTTTTTGRGSISMSISFELNNDYGL